LLPFTAALLGFAVIGSGSVLAQGVSDEARGQTILRSVQQGEKGCGQLADSDFELIGEAWMGQVLGSAEAHDAMNRLMVSMMGTDGEEQMHQFMGRRASGCGGGTAPAGFAAMMGRMGLMGDYQAGAGMMGGSGSSGGYYGPGSMMGGSRSSSSDNNDDGPSAAAMVGMMAVLIGAVGIALAIFRPWRHSRHSREILDRRFAAGELSAEEYRRAKSLLEESPT
jgi:hypothetical protein